MTSAKEKIKIGEGEYEVSWEMTILERVAREALIEDSHLLKNRKEVNLMKGDVCSRQRASAKAL